VVEEIKVWEDTMSKGMLQVVGFLSPQQLWPAGGADADTVKLQLKVGPSSFAFREEKGAPLKVTHVFEEAYTHGRVTRRAINSGKVSVRLQGLDAPELHYIPPALLSPAKRSEEQDALYKAWRRPYRQPLAESAARSLLGLLSAAGKDPLPCKIISHVNEPSEVFDTYGRLVGELFIKIGRSEINVNNWLIRKGWAFPTFYSSMSTEEIEQKLAACTIAMRYERGIWARVGDYVNRVRWSLDFRGPGFWDEKEQGRGLVIPPKLFRRLSTWQVNRKSGMFGGTFAEFLARYPDVCFELGDFLAQGATAATPKKLDEMVTGEGFFIEWPQNLVFQESPSRLSGPSGAPVSGF
jgi:endonuclease YncB( thermonuclease family)